MCAHVHFGGRGIIIIVHLRIGFYVDIGIGTAARTRSKLPLPSHIKPGGGLASRLLVPIQGEGEVTAEGRSKAGIVEYEGQRVFNELPSVNPFSSSLLP